MRLANYAGRSTLVIDNSLRHAVDVNRASGGALSADPMILSDLASHAALRELATSVNPVDWPALDPARLGPPVPRPAKGFGVALNYRQHAMETGRELPTEPALFAKSENAVCGPYDEVVVPAGCDRVDYEAELVIVFGRRCHGVDEADAWGHIAGVTCGQDISDRAEQYREPVRQFTVAKSYDTFGPIGPVLVTPDELTDADALELACRIDGVEVQRSSTSDLIFSVPALVAWLSRYITFLPGDLLWTGTPSGVGVARTPPLFLRAGMVIETEIEGIGVMRNPVVVR